MKPTPKMPTDLKGEAKRFWHGKASILWKSGKLTHLNVETFSLLCKCYGMLCQLDQTPDTANTFATLTAKYQSLCKAFGLYPDSKGKPIEHEHDEETDEYGL